MRPSTVLFVLVSACSQIAIAAPFIKPRQEVSCAQADDNGSPLSNSRAAQVDEDNSGGTVCVYEGAGSCRYFFDGSFSSGSSSCPNFMEQGSGNGGNNDPQPEPEPTTTEAPPIPTVTPTTSERSTSTTMVFVTPTPETTTSIEEAEPTSIEPSSTSTVVVSQTAEPTGGDNVSQNAGSDNGAVPISGQAPFMLATVAGMIAGVLALL